MCRCYTTSWSQNWTSVEIQQCGSNRMVHHSHVRGSMGVVWEMFPGCLISLRGDIPWPVRSLNLAACDFFLWGHLKAEVYKHMPRTTDELKAAIQYEIVAIPPEMTRRVMRNFRVRLQMCIENEAKKRCKHCSFRLWNKTLNSMYDAFFIYLKKLGGISATPCIKEGW
jgi:hypothetical protein